MNLDGIVNQNSKMISPDEFLKAELSIGITPNNPAFSELCRLTAHTATTHINFKTVLDFGAGTGAYSKAFIDAGYRVLTYEIWEAHRKYMLDNIHNIHIIDEPITTDLLVWIEVAEHMTDDEINALFDKISPKYILFSSTSDTTPFDEAWGHINVKSQDQWVNLFDKLGYTLAAQIDKPTPYSKIFALK